MQRFGNKNSKSFEDSKRTADGLQDYKTVY
jgi:hypothetical protein